MDKELKGLLDQLHALEPIEKYIDNLRNRIDGIRHFCKHSDSKYRRKYFNDSEVWHCDNCDSEYLREAEEL